MKSVPRFYVWYHRYAERGASGDSSRSPRRRAATGTRFRHGWRQRVVKAALADPETVRPRELAWQLTDREGHFLSESSVYRILKAYDLISEPSLHRAVGGEVVPASNPSAERALADRLHLSAGARLGLVLPVDGAG